jgi:hypothetical protein
MKVESGHRGRDVGLTMVAIGVVLSPIANPLGG